MTNSIYGIQNIKIKIFQSIYESEVEKQVNEFTKKYNGDILDIQFNFFENNPVAIKTVMVVYTEKDNN